MCLRSSACGALAALTLSSCSQTVEASRPNVVVISIDTLRADHLGAWGETRPTSPRLDRVCAEAVVFRQAISQASITAPAHMSLFTSLHPSVHGVRNSYALARNVEDEGERDEVLAALALDDQALTMAQAFRAGGWRTAAFVGGGQLIGSLGFERGFETWSADLDNGMNANKGQPFDGSLARAWIDEHAAEPFFLFLHTYIPHAPYLPPAPWNRDFNPGYEGDIPFDREAFFAQPVKGERDRNRSFWRPVDADDPEDVRQLRALYAGEVRYADDSIGTLLDALEASGVWDRTILVVLSDHGEAFLEHDNFGHAGGLYEELVHVPLIVRVPGSTPRVVEDVVRTVDVMPTLLDLVGLPLPEQLEGTSLRPWIETGRGRELEAFSEQLTGTNPEPGTRSTSRAVRRSLRTRAWTYMSSGSEANRVEQLYDRGEDPTEQHDLSGDPALAGVLEELRAAMDAHVARTEERAARYQGAELIDLDPELNDELRALGYTR